MFLVCVGVRGLECFKARVWRSEDNLPELILSLAKMSPRAQTQAARLGSKCLCMPSHLPSPLGRFLKLHHYNVEIITLSLVLCVFQVGKFRCKS